MRKAPNFWNLYDLMRSAQCAHAEIDGSWVPARALGMDTLSNRIRLAWGVFTGRYDAVLWPKGQ